MIKYCKKIGYILSKITNPGLFIYLIFHYLQKNVPKALARLFAKKGKEINALLMTYDGSGQNVHPDAVLWGEKMWLVTTPYPFGMEEYENPSIFFGETIYQLTPYEGNPIDQPSKQKIGEHMSDPCLFAFNHQLICMYRMTYRHENYSENYLFIKIWENGIWDERRLIRQSNEDALISPAVVVDSEGLIHLFHIDNINHNTIIHTVYDDEWNILKCFTQKCINMPQGFFVWHIGVTGGNGEKELMGNQLKGVFTLKSEEKKGEFKLCTCSSSIADNKWKFEQELKIETVSERIKHPYKACFVPNTKDVLVSYRNLKDRYGITIVSTEEGLKIDE